MATLTDLPNIGVELEKSLKRIGINTPEELIRVGTENVFIRIKTLDPTACINMLYAIEGAVQGIRWHGLDSNRKQQLKAFFKTCNR